MSSNATRDLTEPRSEMPRAENWAIEALLRLYFGRENVPAWGFSLRAHRSRNVCAARRRLAELQAKRAAEPDAEAQARWGPAIEVAAAVLLVELETANACIGQALPPVEAPEVPAP